MNQTNPFQIRTSIIEKSLTCDRNTPILYALKNNYLSILFIFIFALGYGQKETANWFFGQYAGLNFSSRSPVAQTGSLNTLEGCASAWKKPLIASPHEGQEEEQTQRQIFEMQTNVERWDESKLAYYDSELDVNKRGESRSETERTERIGTLGCKGT